jgi:hypothetical protein
VVFPRFRGGVLNLLKSEAGFVAEVELQVSERVVGFVEQRGRAKTEHVYRPGSEYYQKPIGRFFQTTGVCWYFPDRSVVSEAMAGRVLEAFCVECGIQARDLGVGVFRTKSDPVLAGATAGICIYDATNGSLRLTQLLAERFAQVIDRALTIAEERQEGAQVLAELRSFARMLTMLDGVTPAAAGEVTQTSSDWVAVIAPGQRAIYGSQDGPIEVTVVGYRYTPHGLMYQLVSPRPGSRWLVAADAISSLNGDSLMIQYNVMTGGSNGETTGAAA